MNDNLSIKCRVCSSTNYQYLFHAKNYEIKISLDLSIISAMNAKQYLNCKNSRKYK